MSGSQLAKVGGSMHSANNACRVKGILHVELLKNILVQGVICSLARQQAVTKPQCYLQVLAGVHIMFSRVIPLQEGRPEQHPMWRKAVKFGATCTTQPNDAVTHVAAYVNGTEKVQSPVLADVAFHCVLEDGNRHCIAATVQWLADVNVCK